MYKNIPKKLLLTLLEQLSVKYDFDIENELQIVVDGLPNINHNNNLRLWRAESLAKALFDLWVGINHWQKLEPNLAQNSSSGGVKKIGKIDKPSYLNVKVHALPALGISPHQMILMQSDLKAQLDAKTLADLRALWKIAGSPRYNAIFAYSSQKNTINKNYNHQYKELADFFKNLTKYLQKQS